MSDQGNLQISCRTCFGVLQAWCLAAWLHLFLSIGLVGKTDLQNQTNTTHMTRQENKSIIITYIYIFVYPSTALIFMRFVSFRRWGCFLCLPMLHDSEAGDRWQSWSIVGVKDQLEALGPSSFIAGRNLITCYCFQTLIPEYMPTIRIQYTFWYQTYISHEYSVQSLNVITMHMGLNLVLSHSNSNFRILVLCNLLPGGITV